MAVYDCFTFFNEIELLKFRVQYLKNVVDYFVIIEASSTHSGKPKSQNFSYDLFDDETRQKIKYYYIDFPAEEDLIDFLDFNAEYILQTRESLNSWARENYQRNFIRKCLTNADKDDIILISDVDEIINADAIEYIKQNDYIFETHRTISLTQIPFYYTIYNPRRISLEESVDFWYHPKATLWKYILRPNITRMAKPDAILNDSGWHFGYFGGDNRIKIKKASVATHSHELSDEMDKISQNLINRNNILQNISKQPKELLQMEFNLPSLIFTDEFITFFTGGVS